MITKEHLKTAAKAVGFDLCGVVAVHPLEEDAARFRRWLEAGNHASLGYLERNIEKRFNPAQLVEGAQTVIVCAISYKSEISTGYAEDACAKIASYACNRDYHLTIKELLHALLKQLQSDYPTLTGRAFVDSAPVAEKRWAVEAGLGWIGRQSLLITPEYGSFVHLGELIINEACDSYDTPFEASLCGSCNACITHCPTGAILEGERMIDTRRCIACHTIERATTEPIALDGWIFGCDCCQSCCPYNRRAPMHRSEHFTPRFDPRTLTPDHWRQMSEEEFRCHFADTPLARCGLEHLKRNCD